MSFILQGQSRLVKVGGFPAIGPLRLNRSHWAASQLLLAVLPIGFNNRPLTIVAPRLSLMPLNFTSGAVNSQVTEGGPAFIFSNSAGQVIKTGNQNIFGGKEQITAVAKWVAGSTRNDFQDICRKDTEWTPFQYGGAFESSTNHIHGVVWGSGDAGAGVACGNTLATISGGDIVEAAHAVGVNLTTSGTDTFYLRKNYGALTSANSAAHNTGNISSASGTPLCIGGNESGAELVISDQLQYIMFFETKFTAEQVLDFFLDPFSLFETAEGEMPALFVASGGGPSGPSAHKLLPLLGAG